MTFDTKCVRFRDHGTRLFFFLFTLAFAGFHVLASLPAVCCVLLGEDACAEIILQLA